MATLLAACVPSGAGPTHSGQTEGVYEINPVLREFYDLAGGDAVLGPGISTMFAYDGKLLQYVHAGLMIYDPNTITGNRYYFAPLGLQVGISETPNSTIPASRFVDGYPLYPEFSSKYDQLTRFVGAPLSNPIYNPAHNRWEQYFENFGFYYDLDNPELGARLLGYGSFDCDYACRYTPLEDSAILPNPDDLQVPSPFYEAVDRLGNLFVGQPLTGMYVNDLGQQQMIFSNLILYYDPHAARVFARPMARELGFRRPAMPDNGSDAFSFYPVEGMLGYNVAVQVQAYISQHGGLDISGLPITDMFQLKDQWWQCFNNLCVVYDASQPDELRISTAALGPMYKNLFFDSVDAGAAQPVSATTQNTMVSNFRVSQQMPSVSPGESQTIHVSMEGQNLSGQQLVLYLYVPDQAAQQFNFPPTDAGGHTSLTLPVVNTSQVTLVGFEVCHQGTCVEDAYMVVGP